MRTSKPKYVLERRGFVYHIYRMNYDKTGSTGESIFETIDYASARKKLAELYGWSFKPRNYDRNKTGTTPDKTE